VPYPCTPADGCDMLLIDTALAATDTWFLGVATDDSLVVNTLLTKQSGFVPPYFLRDSGATSLARVRHTMGLPPAVRSPGALLRTRLQMLQRSRQLQAARRQRE